MDGFRTLLSLIAFSAAILVVSVKGQISTPCTSSMISTFTPCINFITGSNSNGSSSPTSSCCDSLKSLMSGSRDCVCLLVTGNVPLPLPISQALAISLPRACKTSVPIQCTASGVPLPAPGPILFAPPPPPIASEPTASPVPTAASPFSPRASKASADAPTPAESTVETTPESFPPVDSVAPTATHGIRPVVTTTPTSTSASASASNPSNYIPSPYMLIVSMGILVFKW